MSKPFILEFGDIEGFLLLCQFLQHPDLAHRMPILRGASGRFRLLFSQMHFYEYILGCLVLISLIESLLARGLINDGAGTFFDGCLTLALPNSVVIVVVSQVETMDDLTLHFG